VRLVTFEAAMPVGRFERVGATQDDGTTVDRNGIRLLPRR